MNKYNYKPLKFYLIVFACTWAFWFSGAYLNNNGNEGLALAFMIIGLFVPAVVSLITVLTSKSKALKNDYRNKLTALHRINIKTVLLAIVVFFVGIVSSILISTLFGGSMSQLSLTNGFSFKTGGVPTLLTLILAATMEEFGWRGYAEDAIANSFSWFKESLIFGVIWSLWHLPLIFMEGTYQYNILHMNPMYAVNFFLSIIPLGFFMTWVYVKNKRSISACIIVHFFINFMQEQIAMTQSTKCIQSVVLIAIAVILVVKNKNMFLETRHVGRLLETSE